MIGLVVGYLSLLMPSVLFGINIWSRPSQQGTTVFTQAFFPKSTSFAVVRLRVADTVGTGTKLSEIDAAFSTLDGKSVSMRGTNDGGGWSFTSMSADAGDFTQIGTPQPTDIKEILRSAGIDIERPDVETECLQVAQFIQEKMAAGPSVGTVAAMTAFRASSPNITSTSSLGTRGRGPDVWVIILCAAIAIWLVGAMLIVVRRLSLIHAAAHFDSVSMQKSS
jgi:hypothetical protein